MVLGGSASEKSVGTIWVLGGSPSQKLAGTTLVLGGSPSEKFAWPTWVLRGSAFLQKVLVHFQREGSRGGGGGREWDGEMYF